MQQRLAIEAIAAIRAEWARINPADFDRSWRRVGPRIAAILTAAQIRAAINGTLYVPEVLAELGIAAAPVARVNPQRFGGIASSGFALDDLLYVPIIEAKQSVAATGATGTKALREARPTLDSIVRTQVADAGRTAVGVDITARPAVAGFVRMLVPPSCSRCVVLAGKWFRWNSGFERHPNCDCRHIPAAEDMTGDLTTDPKAYFNSLSTEEQDATFTKAGAQAIRDGADIGQVVNARRGMTTAAPFGKDIVVTREGVTRRAVAHKTFATQTGRRLKVRLMPEQIYREARSRDDAIRLLKLHGYLI